MIEAVYFDLDDTLFDDRQYVRAGLRRAGEELEARTGVDLTDELLEAYFELGIQERTFDAVLAEHDLPPELVSTLVDAYHGNEADLEPFPGAVETIESLARRYELGVITGGRNGQAKLRRLGLDDHFDPVIVTAEHGTSKRTPQPFEAALEALNLAADEAAYVGDRPSLDFPHPNRLGMWTVRVRTGRYAHLTACGDERPDVTVDALPAVPDAIPDCPQVGES